MANLTGKTIADLPLDSSLSGDELFPVMDNSASKRVPISTLDGRYAMTVTGTKLENVDLDEILTPGTYYVSSPTSIVETSRPPTGGYSYKLTVTRAFTGSGSGPRLWQIAQVMNGNCRECRRNYDGSAWGEWVSLDYGSVNSKLDALGNGNVGFNRFSISANSSQDVEIPNSSHGVIVFTSSATGGGGSGIYAYSCSGAGAVVVNMLVEASSLTISTATNAITFASASVFTIYGLLVSY